MLMSTIAMEPLKLLAHFLRGALQNELSVQGHMAGGTLSKSIEVTVGEAVNGFEIVGRAIYYAKYVESGRRAGATGVPIDALVEWIRQRKINIAGMSERSTAFMFQHSIKQKGIAPSLFITKTLSGSEDEIDRRIHEACAGVVDTCIKTIFNDLNKIQ